MNPVDTEIYISPKLQRKHLHAPAVVAVCLFTVQTLRSVLVVRSIEVAESKIAGKCQELGLPSSCSGLCPGGLRVLSGGRLPYRDRVLGSPGQGPGGCHAGT